MPDRFTKEKRSEVMSRIRSKGSRIEQRMLKSLTEAGIAYQYQPRIFGKPDFFVPPNILIFCDSSFWHGRNWRTLRKKLSKDYWYDHIKKNRSRDRKVNRELAKKGYIVLRFWDTDIKSKINLCIKTIEDQIKKPKK